MRGVSGLGLTLGVCRLKTVALYTTDYPCSHEGSGNVVPSVYLVCPHYGESKVKHLVWLFTKVCGELLHSNILVVPIANQEAHQFDGRIIMSGAANAFPEQLSASLTTLGEPMVARELSMDEVLDLVTPYYQVHYV